MSFELKIPSDCILTKENSGIDFSVFSVCANVKIEQKNKEGKAIELAKFLNYMHYGRPFGEFGWYIFGIMAVACIILMIGGLYQILTLKYKNSTTSQTGTFSKWHRKILLWTMLPFIIITITGAFFNLGNIEKSEGIYSEEYKEALTEFRAEYLHMLEVEYNEKDCPICINKVPEEGIIVRKLKHPSKFEALKLKSKRFLKHESDEQDQNIINIEDQESYEA